MIPARFLWLGAGALAMAAATLGSSGCTTQAFCFDNCAGDTGNTNSTTNTGTGGSGGTLFPTGTGGEGGCFLNCPTTSTGTGGCMETNGGVEICDGIDNDCNGKLDDV